jgi:hypothetical protein
MNATRTWLRIGVFITILGVCMLLSKMAPPVPSAGSIAYSTEPKGTWAMLNVPLLSGSKEVRIKAAGSFEGTLYIYDYQGTRKLIEDGVEEPILNETFKGSTLIDFNLSRRDAYTIVIKSHVADSSQGTVGIVETGPKNGDMLQDYSIITIVGLAMVGVSVAFRLAHPCKSVSQGKHCVPVLSFVNILHSLLQTSHTIERQIREEDRSSSLR